MDWTKQFRRGPEDKPETLATADDVVRHLLVGNALFIQETAPNRPAQSTVPPADGAGLIPFQEPPKQAPCCIVLGCSDARVPAELLFRVTPNQLFVVRVAGNVLGDECLGSIEYALHSFRDTVHLLLVLGHTGCGAVAAAVEAYLNPALHNSIAFTRSLRSVVNHVLIAVRSGALALDEYWGPEVSADTGYQAALAEISVYLNAAMTAFHLHEELQPWESFGCQIAYGIFDVATARVIGPDLNPLTDDNSKLATAPSQSDELIAVGRQIAASPMVARHLSESLRQKRFAPR